MISLLIKEIAEVRIRNVLARAENAVDIKNLFGLSKSETDVAVIQHVNQEVWLKWIDPIAGSGGCIADLWRCPILTKAEDYPRSDCLYSGSAGQRCRGQMARLPERTICLDIFRQLNSEVVEGKLCERDALAKVIQIKNFISELEKLLIPVFKILAYKIFNLLV